MGKIREINAKSRFAFSPASTLVAAGTAAGSSDELSDQPKLEIYNLKLNEQGPDSFELHPEYSIATAARFNDLVWGCVHEDRSNGIIAAAMDDGTVQMWDPATILAGSSNSAAPFHHGKSHTGSVKCVDFSTVNTHLLASAGTKGEFFVWDLKNLSHLPSAYKSSRLDEIVAIAWNKKVGHILALGGRSGALSVWDLKKKTELIHIATRYAISDIAWHPVDPAILMTSSSDDQNPVIQMWDLRQTTKPKAVLAGHERGVLSLSWCAQDPDLLLSSGSDNRTLIWNPSKAEIVAELPVSSESVHQTAWCQKQPSILANATLDGKISIYTIQDTSSPAPIVSQAEQPAGDDFFDTISTNYQAQSSAFTLKQTPKWLCCPVGASFGFGGKLVSFSAAAPGQVAISTFKLDQEIATIASKLEDVLKTDDVSELCKRYSSNAKTEAEKQDWDVIETLGSEKARTALMNYLNVTKEEIERETTLKYGHQTAEQNLSATIEKNEMTDGLDSTESSTRIEDRTLTSSIFGADTADDDLFGGIASQSTANLSTSNQGLTETGQSRSIAASHPFSLFIDSSSDSDNLLTKAILLGQFDNAIDVCLAEDRLLDAFVFALCSDEDSRNRVKKAYFEKINVSYGRLLKSIVAGDLRDIVANADLSSWKEILAMLCNYAKPDEFQDLCEHLGRRLEALGPESRQSATLCYLSGTKLEKLVDIWAQIQSEEEIKSLASADTESTPFSIHVKALSKLIAKVQIFRRAVAFEDSNINQGGQWQLSKLYDRYIEYAEILTSGGDFSMAANYLAYVPSAYLGVDNMRQRFDELEQPANSQKGESAAQPHYRQSGPIAPVNDPYNYSQVPQMYDGAGQNATGGQYQGRTYQPSAYNTYGQQPLQQAGMPTPYAPGPYGPSAVTQSFAPPPSQLPTGPPVLPAALRKDIPAWNDAPPVPLPVSRRPTPSVSTRTAQLTSQLPSTSSPVQAYFPHQAAAALLPPPPKNTRSPAPSQIRPPVASVSSQSQPHNSISSQYAPISQAPIQSYSQSQQPGLPATNRYPSPPQSRYGPSQAQPQQASQDQHRSLPPPPPPPSSTQKFAPPPARGSPQTGNVQPLSSAAVITNQNGSLHQGRQQERPLLASQVSAPPQAHTYPSGDRSHISDSNMPILKELSTELARVKAQAPPQFGRRVEDIERRLNILFDQLNNSLLTDGTIEEVKQLSSAISRREFPRALAIHVELVRDKAVECREWISGVKTLIGLGSAIQ